MRGEGEGASQQNMDVHTLLSIIHAGATVYLVCRNPERGEEARQEIAEKSGNEACVYMCVHVHVSMYV